MKFNPENEALWHSTNRELSLAFEEARELFKFVTKSNPVDPVLLKLFMAKTQHIGEKRISILIDEQKRNRAEQLANGTRFGGKL